MTKETTLATLGRALHDQDLSSPSFRTLLVLIDMAEGESTIQISIAVLARRIGRTEPMAHKHLKELLQLGYLTKKRMRSFKEPTAPNQFTIKVHGS